MTSSASVYSSTSPSVFYSPALLSPPLTTSSSPPMTSQSAPTRFPFPSASPPGPVSLLDLPFAPPTMPYIPAIVSLNKACVLDRKRRRQASTRKAIPCRAWTESGRCNYGERCKFAHGADEMRRAEEESKYHQQGADASAPLSTNKHYRTLPCLKYTLLGSCPYEDRCTYLHGPSIDIERCINDMLEDDEQSAEITGDCLTDGRSTTPSSMSSMPSVAPCSPSLSLSGSGLFDPFYTEEKTTETYEIHPMAPISYF